MVLLLFLMTDENHMGMVFSFSMDFLRATNENILVLTRIRDKRKKILK